MMVQGMYKFLYERAQPNVILKSRYYANTDATINKFSQHAIEWSTFDLYLCKTLVIILVTTLLSK